MDMVFHNPESELERCDVRAAVDGLLTDRGSPEARALTLTLARYIDGRVTRVSRNRYSDLLTRAHQEELVGEVLLELMSGSLSSFRGRSLPELLGFVRRICDRVVWRAARRCIRERDALDGEAGEVVRSWTADSTNPELAVQLDPDSPLDDKDQRYLVELLVAGSRSEHARRQGVSRAAVTQRVQRIRRRIAAMSVHEQSAAEAWLTNRATHVAAGRME